MSRWKTVNTVLEMDSRDSSNLRLDAVRQRGKVTERDTRCAAANGAVVPDLTPVFTQNDMTRSRA